jgi:hypothetical protein
MVASREVVLGGSVEMAFRVSGEVMLGGSMETASGDSMEMAFGVSGEVTLGGFGDVWLCRTGNRVAIFPSC